jgi:chromosome segregation ATPase
VSKSDRKKESKAIHAKCFDEMDKIGRELRLALAEKNDQKAYESQLLQRIQATKAEESSKLQQAIALKETALAENKRLQNEIRQLQQQAELLNASTQDNVPWNDVQPVLHQTHGELVSATTRYWNAIDALQNRRLASYLPGSGVIHGNWTGQYGPLGSLGPDSLPGFTESGNPSSTNQQELGANNVFDSLV